MKKTFVLVLLIAFIPFYAQPVLTEDDLPEIGFTGSFEMTEDTIIEVDVGTTGGPQTWDFSEEIPGIPLDMEVLDPDETPVPDSFPQAEFVYYITGFVVYDTIETEIWQYYRSTQTEMIQLGDYGLVLDTFKIYHDYEPDRTASALPLEMGTSWEDSYHTVDTFGFIVSEQSSSSHHLVDAWGTAVVPAGSFEVLRFISYDTTITESNIQDPDTTATIIYTWVAADVGPVAIIGSRNREENPEFDTAAGYRVLTDYQLPAGMESPYPEPENRMRIKGEILCFNLAQEGPVRIELYDATGRRLETLLDEDLSRGEHSLDLDLSLPRGLYFVQMSTETEARSTKLLILE